MSVNWRRFGIFGTIVLTGFLMFSYICIENSLYTDFLCGCSSTCRTYYPTKTSRIIGDILLFVSTLTFITSLWRIKSISRWWIFPSLVIFIMAFYGNGYMLFNQGVCGNSLNQATFFLNHTKLGDFAKADSETINLDSLKLGKYKGKLLGYHLQGNNLTVYRIADKPLQIKTSFLFWQTDNSKLLEDLSYGLNTFRNFEIEKMKNKYEYIGGQNMPIEAFMEEFKLTEKWIAGKIKNKTITNEKDGTTRLIFEIQ